MIGKGVGPGGREPCPLLVKMKTVIRRMAKPAIISSKIMLHNQNGSKHEYKETQIFLFLWYQGILCFLMTMAMRRVYIYTHW
jgi:hypothetical protein